jgi:hypothetical protein
MKKKMGRKNKALYMMNPSAEEIEMMGMQNDEGFYKEQKI